MNTVLADHATAVLSVDDPVTGETVNLSAMGAVKWLIKYFDYQYNLEHPPEELPENDEENLTEPDPNPEPDGV